MRPGNCSVGKLLSDARFAGAVLNFLSATGVGKVKEGVCLASSARPRWEGVSRSYFLIF